MRNGGVELERNRVGEVRWPEIELRNAAPAAIRIHIPAGMPECKSNNGDLIRVYNRQFNLVSIMDLPILGAIFACLLAIVHWILSGWLMLTLVNWINQLLSPDDQLFQIGFENQ